MCFKEKKSQKILIYWSIHIIDPVRPIWITQIALRQRSWRHTHPESQPALCWRMQKQIRLNRFILTRQKLWARSGGSFAKWKKNITFRSSQESVTLMHLMNLSPNGMKMEARLSRRKSGRLYINRITPQGKLCFAGFSFAHEYGIIKKADF